MGGGRDQPLARTYSSDEGKTWTSIDRLPAWGVQPRIKRLSNGVLVITTGRPGLFLWFSTDPRGKNWQPLDVMAFHNSVMDKAHHISPGKYGLEAVTREQYRTVHHDFDEPDQTTSYTSILEVAPNRFDVEQHPLDRRGNRELAYRLSQLASPDADSLCARGEVAADRVDT